MQKTALLSFKLKTLLSASLLLGSLNACQKIEAGDANSASVPDSSSVSKTMFTARKNIIPFEDRQRRKFDGAVIGDLDRDGLQDIIVNEHGLHMKIFWNNGGTFSKGPIIAKGDVHGAAVGDFDENGNIDVIITQGGGDGKNPRRPLWVEVDDKREITDHGDFDYFEPGRGRVSKFLKSPVDQKLNLFVTGFATPEQTKGANHFYDNLGGGKFKFQGHLPNVSRLGFRSSVTDFNNDGIEDVLIFGAGKVAVARGNKDGSFTDVTDTVFGDLAFIKNVTSVTEIDYDNDGDNDLVFTRAEFPFQIETYFSPEDKRFAFLTFRKDFLFEDMKIGGDLSFINLQRTYPNYDVFLGADKTPFDFKDQEPHGHQDITIKASDAEGWPEGEIKAGLYVGHLGDDMWRIGGQTHSRWAGVVDNVVSVPHAEPKMDMPLVILENKGGVFADASKALGISVLEQTSGATSADFNNDGYLDLAILRYGDMSQVNKHLLYLNNGDGSFRAAIDHGIWANEIGATGGAIVPFDYDNNGQVDLIFSNERGRWHVLENTIPEAKKNNFAVFDISKAPLSGQSPLGVVATLKACGKTQKRRVGAGSETYSQGLNTVMNFGLGSCSKIDSLSLAIPGRDTIVMTGDELKALTLKKQLN